MGRNTLNRVLYQVYLRGLPLQSNFARAYAQEVAALASLGMITTREAPHQYGRTWRITEEGLGFLKEEGYV